MKKRLLAIDLGTHCGVAYKTMTDEYLCETWDFTPKHGHSPGMRWLHFVKRLDEFHALAPIGLVVFEDVTFTTTTHAGHVYGGFLAHLHAWCDKHQVLYTGVAVPLLKKWATGKGNARKEQMIDAAKKMGWTPGDDNQADAALLYEYAKAELVPGLRG